MVVGLGGDDTIIALKGANELYGGAGDDSYMIGFGARNAIYDNEGVNSIIITELGAGFSIAKDENELTIDFYGAGRTSTSANTQVYLAGSLDRLDVGEYLL